MARVRIAVYGMKRLQRDLDKLPPAIAEGAQEAVDDTAEAVRQDAADNVRYYPGHNRSPDHLRNTVRTRKIAPLSTDVGWFDEDSHYATFLEHGTSSIEADPVLTRAAEAERAEFVKRLRAAVRKKVED